MSRVARLALAPATVLALVLAPAALAVSASPQDYDDGELVCTFSDDRISESSGLTVADGLWWTHNDSGNDPRVFAVDESCRTVAVLDLGDLDVRDAESIARGLDSPDGRPTLWLGDIGDNRAVRDRGILLQRIEVPELPSGGVDDDAPVVPIGSTPYRLRYADGPRDAEALLVDPAGQQAVVSKTFLGPSGVFLPTDGLVEGGETMLWRVADVELADIPSESGGPTGAAGPVPARLITGGDVSPNGDRIVLRTYNHAHEWRVRSDERTFEGAIDYAAVFSRGPDLWMVLPSSPQGEAIAYSADGRDLITTSESVGAPVHRLAGVGRVETTAGLRQEGESAAADEGSGPGVAIGVAAAAGLAVVAAAFLLRRSVRSRGRGNR